MTSLDPIATEAARTIRSCPKCGGSHYVAETDRQGDLLTTVRLTTVRLSCSACDHDILEAFRAARKPTLLA